jgi:signal transduction histidine kinase
MSEPSPRWTTAFVSALVHELRTPVASLVLTADLLAGESTAQHRYARAVAEAAGDLRGLLEDVGDLNRLVDGRATPQAAPVAIDDLLRRVVEATRPTADAAGALVLVSEAADTPRTLATDGAMMLRAIVAVVNAALSAGARNVELTCNGAGSSPDVESDGCVFAISDDGEPIRAEDLPRLFVPFGVSNARTRRPHGGNGVALPLAAAIADALGGEVDVESGPLGTRLRLTLPHAA